MNDTDDVLNDVIAEIHRLHGKRMVAGGDELYYGLERALKMLPQDNLEWAVAKPTLIVLTRSAGTLFQIALDSEAKTVGVTSRPIDGGYLVVGLAWGESSSREAGISLRETTWTFRYIGQKEEMQEWQRITGTVTIIRRGGEEIDRLEQFERGLAAQAGWASPELCG